MGTVASMTYKQLRRLANRYNAEHRAHKFLSRDKLPTPPRHKSFALPKLSDNPEYAQELKELNEKNKQLDEYLKKVYLTSTDEGKKQECKRPQPKKRKMNELTFYEPPQPQLNCLTLSSITKILFEYQGNSQINVNDLAEQYKVSKESLIHLMMYYSLFRREKFDFMNIDKKIEKDESKQIEWEVNTRLEKRPVKLLEGKKQ